MGLSSSQYAKAMNDNCHKDIHDKKRGNITVDLNTIWSWMVQGEEMWTSEEEDDDEDLKEDEMSISVYMKPCLIKQCISYDIEKKPVRIQGSSPSSFHSHLSTCHGTLSCHTCDRTLQLREYLSNYEMYHKGEIFDDMWMIWPASSHTNEQCVYCLLCSHFQNPKHHNMSSVNLKEDEYHAMCNECWDYNWVISYDMDVKKIQDLQMYDLLEVEDNGRMRKAFFIQTQGDDSMSIKWENGDGATIDLLQNKIVRCMCKTFTDPFGKARSFESLEEYLVVVHQTPIDLPGIYTADGIFNMEMQLSFTSYQRIMEIVHSMSVKSKEGSISWLLDPYMYAYVHGVSRPHQLIDNESCADFQQLPTNVCIDTMGVACIHPRDYINGLSCKTADPSTYASIEELLSNFIPLLEDCLHDMGTPSVRGSTLQVITSIGEIQLEPDSMFDGHWHKQGVKEDHILATGMVVLDQSSTVDNYGLSFRREITMEEKHDLQNTSADESFAPYENQVDMGSIALETGQFVVFPNTYEHCFNGLFNHSSDEIASLKFITFDFIDPSYPILSTRELPDQRKMRSEMALDIQRASVHSIYRILPQEIVRLIMENLDDNFSIDKAMHYRTRMHEERESQVEMVGIVDYLYMIE